MEEWKEFKLRDIANVQTGPFGSQLHNKDYVTNGTPIVTVEHLGEREFTTQNLPCVSNEDKERLAKYSLEEGDIVFSRVGSVDRCSYVFAKQKGWLFSGRCLRVRPNDSILPLYLYYFLQQEDTKQSIRNIAVGATMPSINTKLLSDVNISAPSLSIQYQITSILSSLDDKIEVNRRINENLEQQAQALFKSWFVDFEPFKDGEFVESELGMIPKGWRAGTLGEICSQSSLKVGSRNDLKVLSPVTTGNLMLSEEYFTKQVFSESIAKYKIVNKGSFAYNPARVNIGSLGRNEYDFDGAVSPVYVVFECKKGFSNYFDLFRTTEKFKTEVLLRAIGGVRQSLNFVDFAMIQTIIAPQDVVDAFNPMIERIKSMQKHLDEENDRLASLRDTLLPKLMSGELKVNN